MGPLRESITYITMVCIKQIKEMITTFPFLLDLGQFALNIFQFDAECHKETHGFHSLLMMCC